LLLKKVLIFGQCGPEKLIWLARYSCDAPLVIDIIQQYLQVNHTTAKCCNLYFCITWALKPGRIKPQLGLMLQQWRRVAKSRPLDLVHFRFKIRYLVVTILMIFPKLYQPEKSQPK